jgi:carboxypeptidase PM20D1
VRLNARPFRKSFTAVNLEMLRTVGAQAKQPYRWLLSNVSLTKGLLLQVFPRLGPETNAMVRTTAVVTRLSGSQADNAMAETAKATVNVRVAIDSSVNEAVAHIRKAIRDDAVSVTAQNPSEPSPVSARQGDGWEHVIGAISRVHPDAIVTPYVMLGASDSRHFTRIADAVYRFTPFELSLAERGALHAVNERIRVATWLKGIRFYEELIGSLAAR